MKMGRLLQTVLLLAVSLEFTTKLNAQDSTNCFLKDFEPRQAVIPASEADNEPIENPSVKITLTADTLGKISKYYFGNAIAVWMGNVTDNPEFVQNVQTLAPSLIRFPGGSWSNIFFWNGKPTDIPDSVYDGTTGKKAKFYPISGRNDWSTTLDNYYLLRQKTGSQGLITINYGYARYGLSDKPAEKAAHLAADWVRYDNGRTRFWEIGNENAGPWEAGWMIDTMTNKDDQPQIITGPLYGQHFKIFADSMKAAAAEIGAEIYIGGQVIHYDGNTSWNSVDKDWNSGFFSGAGDAADFYVMHNYFGSTETVDQLTSIATTEPKKNIDFIRSDILDKNAPIKPIAITEYNMTGNMEAKKAHSSTINGMQSVILYNEFLKNNFGLAARWLLSSGETGMFYQGDDNSLMWQARPEFYYGYFQRLFTGDHVITASSSTKNILVYASKFASGETGVIIINKSKTEEIVSVNSTEVGVGNQYFVFSLTGGDDNGDFSQYVSINGIAPSGTEWGPREQLESIKAKAYPVDGNIYITSPALSVQFVLLEAGNNIVDPTIGVDAKPSKASLNCYPNPMDERTEISFEVPSTSQVSLQIYNSFGQRVGNLVNDVLTAGNHTVSFKRGSLAGGIYFCQFIHGTHSETHKIIVVD